MQPGQPPARRTPLTRSGASLQRGGQLRRTRLASTSEERRQENADRYDGDLLPDLRHRRCELGPAIAALTGWRNCRTWAEHWHERRKAGAAGSRLNPANLVAACDPCNGRLEDAPSMARQLVLRDGRSAVVREGDPEWHDLSRRNDP